MRFEQLLTSEDIQELTAGFVEITGADRETAKDAAKLCDLAYEYSRWISPEFQKPEKHGTVRKCVRQLERLTRDNPRTDALGIDGLAEQHLTLALVARKEFDLYRRWNSRESLCTSAEKLALIHDCAPAVHDAIELLHKSSKGAGRPVLHHQLTLIDNWAGIFHSLFGVTRSHNKGTHCRKLIAECALIFELHTEELADPFMESDTVEKALGNPPKFSGLQLGYK